VSAPSGNCQQQQAINASLLAALIKQALQQGRIGVAKRLAEFRGVEQISAKSLQQLLQQSVRREDGIKSGMITNQLLQLPSAEGMVRKSRQCTGSTPLGVGYRLLLCNLYP
jgi:hypothetical protein